MKRTILACLKFERSDLPLVPALSAGLAVAGEILALIIGLTEHDSAAFAIPAAFLLYGGAFFCMLFAAAYLSHNYSMLLQFSATRRGLLAGLCLHSLLTAALCEVFAVVFSLLLGAVNRNIFFASMTGSLFQVTPWYGFALALVLPILLGIIISGVILRFGKAGGWALYIVFIGVCITTDRWLGFFQQALLTAAGPAVLAGLALALLALAGLCVRWLLKAPVK